MGPTCRNHQKTRAPLGERGKLAPGFFRPCVARPACGAAYRLRLRPRAGLAGLRGDGGACGTSTKGPRRLARRATPAPNSRQARRGRLSARLLARRGERVPVLRNPNPTAPLNPPFRRAARRTEKKPSGPPPRCPPQRGHYRGWVTPGPLRGRERTKASQLALKLGDCGKRGFGGETGEGWPDSAGRGGLDCGGCSPPVRVARGLRSRVARPATPGRRGPRRPACGERDGWRPVAG